jgi:protein TonB
MSTTGTMARPSAWTLSFTAHALLVLALAILVGGGRHPAPPAPAERLVWVEPEAPRPGLPEAAPAPEPPAPAAVAPMAAPRIVEHAPPRPPPVAKPLRGEHPHEAVRPAARAEPAASAPAAPSAPASGDVLGGGSAASGTVGGLGDAPLALRQVAAPPELIDRVLPDYPAQARAAHVEGQVTLEVILDRDGRVEPASIRVTRSVPMLDAAATAAVRQWRFRPARGRDGAPVRVLMEIPVRFVLR